MRCAPALGPSPEGAGRVRASEAAGPWALGRGRSVVTVLLEVTEGGNTVSAEKTSNSGAKGFAIILGSMVGIIGILWLIGALLSSH